MIFDDYRQHTDTIIRPSLLWEFDLSRFDWAKMRNVVVQRVLERGRMDDYYAMLNLYGWEGVREALRMIPYMNRKDLSFACFVFDLKKEELRCCTMRPSHPLFGHF